MLLGTIKVSATDLVEVGVTVLVGTTVSVPVGELVELIFGTENACTVSTIMVFMLEITKSTMPAVGVPIWTALLISLMPTTAALHIKLTPKTAARTSPRSGK